MKNFASKVAFVTGGASGIGLGIVRAFLGEGMKVVAADWNEEHLAQARIALSGNNAVHFIKVDVADRADLKRAADEALATFGKIHVLVNNAGVGGGGNVDDPEFDEWDKAIAINLGGVVNGVKIFAPIIKAQGEGGHIVNTSSAAGIIPLPGMGAYSTSKYAVRGLTESLRLQLAPHGIGVSCLYPGAVKTALVVVPEDDGEGADPMLVQLWEAMRNAMDPIEVGEIVVQAIRENRPHILTHGEFLDEVSERNRVFEAGFPTGTPIPEPRRKFENSRRKAVDELMALPVKD
jgi:NAD(P)-dependent dehydrogenase (short-subunit alcohol dehydrogenase family)